MSEISGIEHPAITRVRRTGYPNMVAKPDNTRLDYFGDEIIQGDEIVTDPNFGEVILRENLEKYLLEVYKFTFTQE